MHKILLCWLCAAVLGWAANANVNPKTHSNAQINSIYDLILRNDFDRAHKVAQQALSTATAAQQGELYAAQSLLWEIRGQQDSAIHHALRSYEVSGAADLLSSRFHLFLQPLRRADPVFLPRLQQIHAHLAKHNPSHPLRFEFYAELLTAHLLDSAFLARNPERYMDSLGVVRTWQWVGPFDNISNGGMHQVLAPEKGFKISDSYPGKNGVAVKWRSAQPTSIYGWTFLDQVQGVSHAVNYFATTLTSPRAQNVVLSLGVSGAYSLWVNGVQVAHSTEFHNRGSEGWRLEVPFTSGENHILLKLGHEDAFSNFMLRVSDKNLRPLVLRAQAKGQKAVQLADRSAEFAQIPSPEKRWRSAKAADIAAQVYLADFYVHHDYFDSAGQILAQLQARYPQSVWLALQKAYVLGQRADYTGAEMEAQRAWNLDSTAAGAWGARLESFSSDPQQVVQLFKQKSPWITPTVAQQFALIKAHIFLGQDSLVWARTAQLQAQSARDHYATIYAAAVHSALGEPADALAMLAAHRAQIPAFAELAYELYDTYQSQGQIDAAIAVVQTVLRYHPQNLPYWQRLAELYFLQKKWDLVQSTAAQGLAVNPQSAELWQQKARAWEMQGQADSAQRAYAQALALGQHNFTLSDRLLQLQGWPNLTALPTPWTVDSLLKIPAAGADSAAAEVLLNQRTALVHNWGGWEQLVRLVVQVHNHKGVDYWKEFDGWSYFDGGELEVTRAQTLKADGSVLNADVHYAQVVFKTLAPGDRIEIVLHHKNILQGELAGHFWLRHYLGAQHPTRVAEFALYAPPQLKFQQRVTNFKGQLTPPVKSPLRPDLQVQKLVVYNLPGTQYESYMPPWSDVLPAITASSLPNWNQINRWYASLSTAKSSANGAMRRLADSLYAGAPAAAEKVRRTHEYMAQNIRYSYVPFRQSGFVPQSAVQTLATRMGDCKDMAVLAQGLLRLGGVASNVVLVNTNDQEQRPPLPLIVFNHAILKLASGEYIDFTAGQNGVWTLPYLDQGALSLEIDPQRTTSIAYLPTAHAQDRVERHNRDSLDAQGNYHRTQQTVRTGNYASAFRNLHSGETAKQSALWSVRALHQKYPAVKLHHWSAANLPNLYTPVQNAVHYSLLHHATPGPAWNFSLPWSDALQPADLPAENQRQYDFLPSQQPKLRGVMVENLVLQWPPGWKLTTLPSDFRIKQWGIDYQISYQRAVQGLRATRRLEVESEAITPQNYAAFRSLLAQIVQRDGQNLQLQPAPSAP